MSLGQQMGLGYLVLYTSNDTPKAIAIRSTRTAAFVHISGCEPETWKARSSKDVVAESFGLRIEDVERWSDICCRQSSGAP